MKERPILFSGPMIRAILAGQKTQTRRLLYVRTKRIASACFDSRYPPDYGNGEWPNLAPGEEWTLSDWRKAHPGVRLWVRETFYAWGRWETRFNAKKGRDEWHFVDMTLECGKAYVYPASDKQPQPMAGRRDGGVKPKWWKRPAIHMPRAASRISLEITGVRVERLQDINDADVRAEGAAAHPDGPWHAWRSLWTLVNGAESWAANPWVWAIEFRRVQ